MTIETSGACVAWLALAASCPALAAGGHTLSNTRLSVTFGSTANGWTTANADRVDAITWVNSAGGTISNLVANGGPVHCGDPQEFFGQAYGDNGTARPFAIIAGDLASWTDIAAGQARVTVTSTAACGSMLDATTVTRYAISSKPGLINALKIVRSYSFVAAPAPGNLRAYVPRLPLASYPVVLAPNAAGIVQSYTAGSCGGGCAVTDWNGKWLADDDGSGNGVAVFRSTTANKPAQLTVDNDSFSGSNNSSVTLIQPAGGWTGTVTETEYLCFYDATSWSAAKRNAGTPPAGCGGVPH